MFDPLRVPASSADVFEEPFEPEPFDPDPPEPTVPAPTERAALVHAVDQGGEHVELLRILVLGDVVLARVHAEHVLGDLVRLADEAAELLRDFEVDRH